MKPRNKEYVRRTKIFILVCALIAGMLAPGATLHVAAAPKWKTAYKKILKNWKTVEKYEDMSYLKFYFDKDYKFNRYFTYDVNKDGTPELFLYSTTMGMTEVLTYRKGKIVSLGYDNIYGIKKNKKVIIVQGHWHGAGGSGVDEWVVYTIGKKELKLKYYIDKMDKISVNGKKASKSAYNKIYKNYVKGTTKLSKFKKYKLSNTKGLK